jgi:anti-anti-sigma factor
MPMEISVKDEGGCSVVAVKDRLDTMTVWDFEQKVNGLVQEGRQKMVLDLSGLEYISSAGLRSLLALSKKLKAKEGALAICGLQGLPKEIFAVSGFDTVFHLYGTVAEAAASL